MAVLWHLSHTPRHDPSDAPYAGALAYFFDAGTTTPQTTYTTDAEDVPHDHPVEADGNGMFPAVFLAEQTTYRMRITTAAGETLVDTDNIRVPTTTPPEIPDSDTPIDQRFQTGDIKMRWAISAPNGWVRVNGRTIGAAASGATERANADCENLFIFLWNNDANLAVSGGRGGTANGDWAANKTIALPDFRGRVPSGPDAFGNSAANRITDAILGQDSDTIGRSGGAETHTLVSGELPTITPTFTGQAMAAHGHPMRVRHSPASSLSGTGGVMFDSSTGTDAAYTGTPSDTNGQGLGGQSAGTPAGTISSFGSDDPHNNLQPTLIVPYFIKL